MSCYYKVPEPLLGSKIIKILEPPWPIVLLVDNWRRNKEENACSNRKRERERERESQIVRQTSVHLLNSIPPSPFISFPYYYYYYYYYFFPCFGLWSIPTRKLKTPKPQAPTVLSLPLHSSLSLFLSFSLGQVRWNRRIQWLPLILNPQATRPNPNTNPRRSPSQSKAINPSQKP